MGGHLLIGGVELWLVAVSAGDPRTQVVADHDLGAASEELEGVMAHELGRVPIAGAEATIQGLHLTAENVAGRRNKLGTVLIERIKDKSPQE